MAKAKNTVIFSEAVKHNGLTFAPTIAIRFDDPDAAPYFVKCGWAKHTSDEPVMTFDEGSVSIDPDTIDNETGLKVQDVTAKVEV